MNRRSFITMVGGAAAACPLAARGQQPAMPVVGFLSTRASGDDLHLVAAVRRGLRETGFIEDQPALAADLVRRQVPVITAGPTPAALAAKAATTTIPIVFEVATDPVAVGLVASLSRPGGNVTGVTNLGVKIAPKRLELLHELLPTVTNIALLINPTSPVVAEALLRDSQAAARAIGKSIKAVNANSESELEAARARERHRHRTGG